MTPDSPSSQFPAEMIEALAGYPFYSEAAQAASRDLKQRIAQLAPIPTAARVAGLLTCPELGANAHRLEVLLGEVLQHAHGDGELDGACLQKLFSLLDAAGYSMQEDPAEDIFVSLVMDQSRHYRVFEGIYESNTFYLQRFIEAISSMPSRDPFNALRKSVRSLLLISDTIADRSGIPRYTAGEEFHRDKIPTDIHSRLHSLADRIRFTTADLDSLGISLADLRPFVTHLNDWQRHTNNERHIPELECMPLLEHKGTVYVLSPSYISPAIRRLVVSFCAHRNELESLYAEVAQSYSKLFHEMSLLRDIKKMPTNWVAQDGLLVSECAKEVDPGRFIHFLLIADDFQDAEQTGFSKPGNAISTAGELLAQRIECAANQFCKQPSFRRGLSLVVLCGWGRAIFCDMAPPSVSGWEVEFVSASQLITLSRVHRMSPLILFRLRDHVSALKDSNVKLDNINGLLNLYAWAEDCGRDLIPHDHIKPEMVHGPGPLRILITQNALYQIRTKVAQDDDTHIAVTPEGQAVRVRRYATRSYFSDEAREPLYGSFDDALEGRMKSVYEGKRLNVWLTTDLEGFANRDYLYTVFDAFSKWLPIIVPVIEGNLTACTHGNILWHIGFLDYDPSIYPVNDPAATADSLTSHVDLDADAHSGILRVSVPRSVYDEFHRADNCAEKAVLRALVRGTAELLGCVLDDKAIVEKAIPSNDARQFHSFAAQSFMDYVSDQLPHKPFMLEEFDESLTRLGLAWRIQDPSNSLITGIDECTRFLNPIIDELWDDIRKGLCDLDRQKMLQALMMNIEALLWEGRRWKLTARAMLALNGNDQNIHRRMTDQAFKRTATIVNSRILMEIALCECKCEDGATPGQLDMAQLLSKVSILNQMGGWSDAIRKEAIPAEVRISSLGIPQVDHTFHEDIILPFGYKYGEQQQSHAAERYEDMFRESQPVPSTTDAFDLEFQEAWLAEFGFKIDEGRRFLDDIEDHGLKLKQPIFFLRQSELLGLRSDELSEEVTSRILSALQLIARDQWDVPPNGFTMKDVEPWRYRRRLSVTYRPILQCDTSDNPWYLIAPSFIREGFIYRIDGAYNARFDESHFSSPEMRRWIGTRRNQTGHRFNQEVADELIKHGWCCQAETKLPTIGISAGDKDYGDIDVLAWHEQQQRVVAIECKDLMFAKTPGEIARQLYEFRGNMDDKGRPDRLRRHLDRLKVLRENQAVIDKFTGLQGAVVESALVFRNVVPIQFMDTEELRKARVMYFSELSQL